MARLEVELHERVLEVRAPLDSCKNVAAGEEQGASAVAMTAIPTSTARCVKETPLRSGSPTA